MTTYVSMPYYLTDNLPSQQFIKLLYSRSILINLKDLLSEYHHLYFITFCNSALSAYQPLVLGESNVCFLSV